MFRLAHLSDLHATEPRATHPRELLNKRALGWLSWRAKRRREHRTHVLEALARDLDETAPDHVAVTGDLTNLGLPGEFEDALGWLERLGGPERVSVVPGNHDATVAMPRAASIGRWSAYLASSPDGGVAGGATDGFPFVRVRGPVALIGLSSARPTAPGLATGALGAAQRERLSRVLGALGESGLCRVVLIHHPPHEDGGPARKRLVDAAPLREVLGRAGAELVLHGHSHRRSRAAIESAHGPIPVVGVPSSSALGRGHGDRAQYHLLRFEPARAGGGSRLRVSIEVRGLDASGQRFVREGEEPL